MKNATNNGRDERGKFAKGCRGGPGRPSRRTEADYLAALSGVVSLTRWRAIAERAAADAADGDDKARDFIAKYLPSTPGRDLLADGDGDAKPADQLDDTELAAALQQLIGGTAGGGHE